MNSELKKTREEKGLTQTELSDSCGIALISYQRYEAGKRTPDVYIALRLAHALHTTVEELFDAAPDTTNLSKI